MYDTTYKGYLIRYHQPGDSWVAHIYRPGELRIMTGGVVTATKDEGSSVLLQRAHRAIDADLIGLNKSNP